MKLETFLKKIKPQKTANDLLDIYAVETLPNGDKINFYVDAIFIKRHPIILKADLIKYGKYESKATDGINGHEHKINIFYAIVDKDQYDIAKRSN